MKKTDLKTGKFVKLESAGPLHKCEPLLPYMRMKRGRGWRSGKRLSLDEETMGFKGRCALVTRIKCTHKGGGLQADCI